jgi:predicted MFS family arabinose efflux permease
MAAEDIGFYYAANALGCFFGTLLSGLPFQVGGILACLLGSALILAACFTVTFAPPMRRADAAD